LLIEKILTRRNHQCHWHQHYKYYLFHDLNF
jgi:hypothetical protein